MLFPIVLQYINKWNITIWKPVKSFNTSHPSIDKYLEKYLTIKNSQNKELNIAQRRETNGIYYTPTFNVSYHINDNGVKFVITKISHGQYRIDYHGDCIKDIIYPLFDKVLEENTFKITNFYIGFYLKKYFTNNKNLNIPLKISSDNKYYECVKNVRYEINDDSGVKFGIKEIGIETYEIYYTGDCLKDVIPLFSVDQEKLQVIKNISVSYMNSNGCHYVKTLHTSNHISDIVIDSTILCNIYKDIDTFYSKKDYYIARNKPFKRCYLFSGLPGTGKTSLIQEIAIKYRLNILYVKLVGFSIQKLLTDLRNADNTVIVFEDLSHEILLNASKDQIKKDEYIQGLSTDDILNLFDGIISPFTNNLIFITSNDLSGISKAVLRPGRIDYHIQFTYASKEQVTKIFEKYNVQETKLDKYIGKFTTSEIINKIQLKEIN